jgi:hypothetical protein
VQFTTPAAPAAHIPAIVASLAVRAIRPSGNLRWPLARLTRRRCTSLASIQTRSTSQHFRASVFGDLFLSSSPAAPEMGQRWRKLVTASSTTQMPQAKSACYFRCYLSRRWRRLLCEHRLVWSPVYASETPPVAIHSAFYTAASLYQRHHLGLCQGSADNCQFTEEARGRLRPAPYRFNTGVASIVLFRVASFNARASTILESVSFSKAFPTVPNSVHQSLLAVDYNSSRNTLSRIRVA